ncbi:hypothetical protein EYZ11_002026 [Aspergillus tanneri]|uniref:Uncharacterized protein n=1 Tax=Aspergillus tanneri TaxID=1220188 RepID=A0A4S3JTH2_9EURO|nr:hypothetical protein EYZ11_002026 [Aspergillus tanneri]
MASQSRLTFASIWAFEDTAVEELERKPALTSIVIVNIQKRMMFVLLIKGPLDGPVSKVADILSRYIDEQKHKDLLDVPQIRQLDIPSALQDDSNPVLDEHNESQEGDLLALDEDPNEELIPHSIDRVTKHWVSSDGGVGCFAANFHDILSSIAIMTGTEIAVAEDLKGIQVSAKNSNDVDDALAKISRIEKSLSSIDKPHVRNMVISADDQTTRFCIQNYSSLNPVAMRRILTDPTLNSNSSLGQMFVTTALSFDDDAQAFKLPQNLVTPPRVEEEPGKSRIWKDFTFQAIGAGDRFLRMESVVEKAHSDPAVALMGDSVPHRYLSAEKVKQVDQWVAENKIVQTEQEWEPNLASQPEPPSESIIRPPGIKSRRAVTSNPKGSIPSSNSPPTRSEPAKGPADDTTSSPRKKWKMTYEIESGSKNSQSAEPITGAGKQDRDVLCGIAFVPANISPPENRSRLPSNFDVTKYGANKYGANKLSHSMMKTMWEHPKPHRVNENICPGPGRKPRKESQLVDVFAPAYTTNIGPPPLSFDQPALIPEKLLVDGESKCNSNNMPIPHGIGNMHDLAGLDFDSNVSFAEDEFLEQEKRLSRLQKIYEVQKEDVGCVNIANTATTYRPVSRRHVNRVLAQERLTELEKCHRLEASQSSDEVGSRKFYLTMNQRAPKSTGKSMSKSEINVKRQATLEDAWGIPKQPVKQVASGDSRNERSFEKREMGQTMSEGRPNKQQLQNAKAELHTNEEIKHLFEALKQTLEAAEYFPGPLSLEVQFGLVLIPLLPKTYKEGLISAGEWTRIFQPRTGIVAPTTKFTNRLTTSGSDVDYIVGLKESKAQGRRQAFEQGDNEYCVFYEYHCRSKSGQLLIITMNEQGSHSIRRPTTALGGVNLHFPSHTWDANISVNGAAGYNMGSNPEFEKAAQYLVDHIWIPPDKQLIQIFSQIPQGSELSIEKVFMKRWTRHRYIRPDETSPKDAAISDSASSTRLRAGSTQASEFTETQMAPREVTSRDHDSLNSGVETGAENQDIFLQITEVQDLIIGTGVSDAQAVKARCAPLLDMLKNGRQWYEVSLVSPAIETILKANANLELGERTDDWRSTDLFGKDALLCNDSSEDSRAKASPGPVAVAIGDTGIGDLFRLAKMVIEKIDGVGFWNFNPIAEAVRMAPVGSLDAPPGMLSVPATSLPVANTKVEPKSFNHDELESIKEVGSATVDVSKKSSSTPSAKLMEQIEEEYW